MIRPIAAVAAVLALLLSAGCSAGSTSGAATSTTAATTTAGPAPATVTTDAHASLITAAPLPSMAAPCVSEDERMYGVHFTAADETLEGIVFGTGNVGIVLAHESDGDLCQWKPYAIALSRLGYRVLAYTSGMHTEAGVVAAAAELRAKGATRIMLVGASMGGTAVLTAAPDITPPVAAVVDLSGPTFFEDVDATDAITHLSVPTLFMAGTLDTPFVTDTKAMYKAAVHSTGRKLVLVPGGDHGIALWSTTPRRSRPSCTSTPEGSKPGLCAGAEASRCRRRRCTGRSPARRISATCH